MRLMTRMKFQLLKAEILAHKMYFSWKQAQQLLTQYPDVVQLAEMIVSTPETRRQLDQIFASLRVA